MIYSNWVILACKNFICILETQQLVAVDVQTLTTPQ
jgi:hypothetical protein